MNSEWCDGRGVADSSPSVTTPSELKKAAATTVHYTEANQSIVVYALLPTSEAIHIIIIIITHDMTCNNYTLIIVPASVRTPSFIMPIFFVHCFFFTGVSFTVKYRLFYRKTYIENFVTEPVIYLITGSVKILETK